MPSYKKRKEILANAFRVTPEEKERIQKGFEEMEYIRQKAEEHKDRDESYNAYDDPEYLKLFMPDRIRAKLDPNNEVVMELPIDRIRDFEVDIESVLLDENGNEIDTMLRHFTHPFQVEDDANMMDLARSIKEDGQKEPAIVWEQEDENGLNNYMMLSGHRRKRAIQLNGDKTIRCIVVKGNLTMAAQTMAACNNHRKEIKPSAKGEVYRMLLEISQSNNPKYGQGKRNDIKSDETGTNDQQKQPSQSRDQIGKTLYGDSGRMVSFYIRLSYLIPELQNLIDEKKLAIRQGVELSYIDSDLQQVIYREMVDLDCGITLQQAKELRGLNKNGRKITPDIVRSIIEKPKRNQEDKVSIILSDYQHLIPSDVLTIEDDKRRQEEEKTFIRSELDLMAAIKSWIPKEYSGDPETFLRAAVRDYTKKWRSNR